MQYVNERTPERQITPEEYLADQKSRIANARGGHSASARFS
jgi:hypothetical protein